MDSVHATQPALLADKAGRQSRRIWQGIVNERGLDVPLPSGQDLTDYYQSGHNLGGLLRPLLQSDRPSLDFPLVIRWPAKAGMATIGGQWRRLPDGQIEATCVQAKIHCPVCQQPVQRKHSHYGRTAADLPWAEFSVCLKLRVHRFFCDNEVCHRKIFTERLPDFGLLRLDAPCG